MLRYKNVQSKQYIATLVLVLCVLMCHAKENVSNAKVTQLTNLSPTTATASAIKITAANAMSVTPLKDGLNKRNVKANDFSNANSASAKSYDPPPEFYRGPGSTPSSSSSGSSDYTNRDSATAGFVSKPITFPAGHHDASGDSTSYLANEYNSWQLLRGKGYGSGQDRISVGHYGSPDHSVSHGPGSSYVHGSGISVGYGYDGGHAYGGGGSGYHNEYAGNGIRYPVSGHGGGGGYYVGSNSAETGGIPFDVYGTKGHYAGAGGEYSYSSYPDAHEPATHKGPGGDWQHKALLAKSFLIPLASAAVLGIAAALVSNPLLLQLGTVSGIGVGPTVVGKRRKRRDLQQAETSVAGLTTKKAQIPSSSGNALAYHAHRQRRMPRV